MVLPVSGLLTLSRVVQVTSEIIYSVLGSVLHMSQMGMMYPFPSAMTHREVIGAEVKRPIPGDNLLHCRGSRDEDSVIDLGETEREWKEMKDFNHQAAKKNMSVIQQDTIEIITFNVRGVRYEIEKSCLEFAPKTSKFAYLETLDSYDNEKKEYYFNRDPYIFNSLINFLVNGELHFRRCVCIDELNKEMVFWGMDDYLLQHCCWERAQNEKIRTKSMTVVEREWYGMVLDYEDKKQYEVPFRDKLWLFLEEPASSVAAQIWSTFVLVLVFTSNVILAMETLPEFRSFSTPEAEYNFTNGLVTEQKVIYRLYHSHPHIGLVGLDITCFFLMTMELLLRFSVSKEKGKFCLSLLNIIDFVALLPMWISLPMFGIRQAQHTSPSVSTAFYVLGGMRLLRTFRAIRIMKSYKPMKILLLALKASYKEMLLLIFLVTVVAVAFGNVLFFSEIHTDKVTSIPDAVWWAIITMTTVGYGDIVPESAGGKAIGAACAISGIVVVAMPVPVIVANFSFYYDCLKSILQARSLRTKQNTEKKFNKY